MQKLQKLINKFLFLIFIASFVGRLNLFANSTTKYTSTETKEIVEKMIDAHGGLEKWKSTPNSVARAEDPGP